MSNYTKVELDSWNRKETFDFFNGMTYPYLTISSRLEITEAYNLAKSNKKSLYATISWLILKALNQINEFKCRVENNSILSFDRLGASFSVLKTDNSLNFSRFTDFNEEYDVFLDNFIKNKQEAESGTEIANTEKNLVYLTCLPKIELAQMISPMDLKTKDSITRICWGKVYKEQEKKYITLSVQVHHGLIDGFHIGILNELIEKESKLLGEKYEKNSVYRFR
ncbi:CatA-like O-acetyltransferase [Bacillus cereus]|uniref:CatA-like O-acetyltransferase n=1 Tax=Bacillus cereus TaxID=1396 RepID=UPI0007B92D04|nr:CatA-like O-acetyltransferase [Bacillus cereus]